MKEEKVIYYYQIGYSMREIVTLLYLSRNTIKKFLNNKIRKET